MSERATKQLNSISTRSIDLIRSIYSLALPLPITPSHTFSLSIVVASSNHAHCEMDTTFRFMKSGSEPETQSVLSFVEEENLLASSSCTLVVPRRPIALSGYRTKVFPTLSERDIRDHVIQGIMT